jgi:hypothetical protein
MYTHIDPLAVYYISGLLWVRERFVFFRSVHELVLAGRAGVLTPEAFKIDGANIAATTLNAEKAVDLFKILERSLVVEAIATA